MTEPDHYVVSHSEAESYRSCERRHFYTYGMKLEPAFGNGMSSVSDPLYRGILGHTGLAEYFIALREKLSKNEILDRSLSAVESNTNIRGRVVEKIKMQVYDLIYGFHKYRFPELSSWQILEVEEDFEFEILPGELATIIFPDLVARIPGKGYTVVDHKFKYDFFNQPMLALSTQLPKYAVGLRERYPIRHAMFNVLRYRTLKEPQPDDQFRFQDVPLSSKRARATFEEHIKTAREIKSHRDEGLEKWESAIVRNPTDNCSWCDFALLCETDLNGINRDLMVAYDFQPRTRRSKREVKLQNA